MMDVLLAIYSYRWVPAVLWTVLGALAGVMLNIGLAVLIGGMVRQRERQVPLDVGER